MIKKCLLVFLVLSVCSQPVMFADTLDDETKYQTLLDDFLSEDYMNADSCESFRAGKEKHDAKRVELLYVGTKTLRMIMRKLDFDVDIDDIQAEWLFRLAEEICYKDPSGFKILKEEYPYFYDLIAACRTREAFAFLADEANSASGGSTLLESLLSFSTDEENENEEDAESLKTLLILLGIDGENYDAFTTLAENNDKGLFLFTARLMDVYNREYIRQPYLSEDYGEMILDYLDINIESDVLGMVLGDAERTARVKKYLLAMDITSLTEDKQEETSLYYQWYIVTQLRKKLLDKEIIKKFMDFASVHDLDTLEIRRDIAKQCGKGDNTYSKGVCDFIFKTPSLRTNDPVENCIYPELTNYSEVIINE